MIRPQQGSSLCIDTGAARPYMQNISTHSEDLYSKRTIHYQYCVMFRSSF